MRRAFIVLVAATAAGCGGVSPEDSSARSGATTTVTAPTDAKVWPPKGRFPEIPIPDGRSAFTITLDPDMLMGDGVILPGSRVDVAAVLSHDRGAERLERIIPDVLVLRCELFSDQVARNLVWTATLALTPDECATLAESAKVHPIWLLYLTPRYLKR